MSDDSSLHPSYLISEVSDNYNDWGWWRGRFQHRVNMPIQQKIRPPSTATNILQKDWDTLVVLDACRADLFAEVIGDSCSHLDFSSQRTAMSNASMTPEWLQRTFDNSHGDIVYVAGNPMVTQHRPEAFHKLIEVWRNAYNPDDSVITPKEVTGQALSARSRFPNKRLIIHYMQPHYPFIDRPELNHADYNFEEIELEKSPTDKKDDINSVWDALSLNIVSKEAVWEGYKHNLEVVMEEVETLLNSIDDRTVVTSDHGNMLGGRNWPVPIRTYGHPTNLRHKGLIQVPWVVTEGERREIIDEGTFSSSSATDQEVGDRLSNLGYIQ